MIVIAPIMLLLDATVVNVALPSAQAGLHFSDATRQWVVTAYVLAFGSLLALGGRLADAYGIKTTFVVGLAGFTAAAAVAGAAPNIGTLIPAGTVHGFSVGYWWAAGAFWAAALLCGALIRGGTRLHHEADQPEPLDEIVSSLI